MNALYNLHHAKYEANYFPLVLDSTNAFMNKCMMYLSEVSIAKSWQMFHKHECDSPGLSTLLCFCSIKWIGKQLRLLMSRSADCGCHRIAVVYFCLATWKRHSTGELSTAGTTASTVIFRGDHIFVANVGDSTAVLAVNNPHKNQIGQHPVKAIVLTKDHKAEDPDEIRTIKGLGIVIILIHLTLIFLVRNVLNLEEIPRS